MDLEKLIYLGVGAIIGFALSLAKDWLLEGKKQKEKEKQLKRERLEELHIGFSKWVNYVVSNEMTLLAVMNNKLTFNQYLDLKIDKKTDFDAQRNEMILKVYIKSLISLHEEVRDQLEYLNHIESQYKRDYEKKGPHSTDKKYIERNKLFTEKFIVISEKFKIQLASEISKFV